MRASLILTGKERYKSNFDNLLKCATLLSANWSSKVLVLETKTRLHNMATGALSYEGSNNQLPIFNAV